MNRLKVIAISDNHGLLPEIKTPADILCIAGDFSPLESQMHSQEMVSWVKNKFIPWSESLPVTNVVLVAGNHDFCMEDKSAAPEIKRMFNENGKIFYLENTTLDIDSKIIYGSPNTIGPRGWAFYEKPLDSIRNNMPFNADLCIFHQPLHDSANGTVMIPASWELDALYPDYGSKFLDQLVYERSPKMVVTGHVHTGNHSVCEMPNAAYQVSKFANVSLLNEDYELFYEPLEFEI
jgi:Icc-related predicted phosphoesterase